MNHIDVINKSDLIYTKCYCEENIWKLCDKLRTSHSEVFSEYYVIFISNHIQFIPLWLQRASTVPDGFIIWDYHVILIHKIIPGISLVYDFDTTLNFPCSFETYLKMCIRNEDNMLEKFHRLFRVIKADEYLLNFASDRSHMKNNDGTWKMPPPQYPPIHTSKSENNLKHFISMRNEGEEDFGVVMNLKELIGFMSSNKPI